jgi:hypothetical protein
MAFGQKRCRLCGGKVRRGDVCPSCNDPRKRNVREPARPERPKPQARAETCSKCRVGKIRGGMCSNRNCR